MLISSRKRYGWETETANETLVGHYTFFFLLKVARVINKCSMFQNLRFRKQYCPPKFCRTKFLFPATLMLRVLIVLPPLSLSTLIAGTIFFQTPPPAALGTRVQQLLFCPRSTLYIYIDIYIYEYKVSSRTLGPKFECHNV